MYNSNFYNNFPQNDFTFRHPPPTFIPPPQIPPPPIPPSFFIPPMAVQNKPADQEFIKQFDRVPKKHALPKLNLSISSVKQKLQNLILVLNKIKDNEQYLSENLNSMSDSEWSSTKTEIEENKIKIANIIEHVTSYLDILRKLLAKRSAKRMRLRRVRIERKKEKEKKMKEMKEHSRKIDENLQKIKDEIDKVKQEEEAKIQADIVLKEVTRKKHDAKKYLIKLDALMKLRKARQNTAKGRGENVLERDAEMFNTNIEKLKSLWQQKLCQYEKEETELRATLKQNQLEDTQSVKEQQTINNLKKWNDLLFGGKEMPQVDFQHDVGRFIRIRSQWDQYVSSEGTPLPIGWAVPKLE